MIKIDSSLNLESKIENLTKLTANGSATKLLSDNFSVVKTSNQDFRKLIETISKLERDLAVKEHSLLGKRSELEGFQKRDFENKKKIKKLETTVGKLQNTIEDSGKLAHLQNQKIIILEREVSKGKSACEILEENFESEKRSKGEMVHKLNHEYKMLWIENTETLEFNKELNQQLHTLDRAKVDMQTKIESDHNMSLLAYNEILAKYEATLEELELSQIKLQNLTELRCSNSTNFEINSRKLEELQGSLEEFEEMKVRNKRNETKIGDLYKLNENLIQENKFSKEKLSKAETFMTQQKNILQNLQQKNNSLLEGNHKFQKGLSGGGDIQNVGSEGNMEIHLKRNKLGLLENQDLINRNLGLQEEALALKDQLMHSQTRISGLQRENKTLSTLNWELEKTSNLFYTEQKAQEDKLLDIMAKNKNLLSIIKVLDADTIGLDSVMNESPEPKAKDLDLNDISSEHESQIQASSTSLPGNCEIIQSAVKYETQEATKESPGSAKSPLGQLGNKPAQPKVGYLEKRLRLFENKNRNTEGENEKLKRKLKTYIQDLTLKENQ